MILSLPLDVFEYLLDFIGDRRTLLSLQLVSKSHDAAVLPKLWRAVDSSRHPGRCAKDYQSGRHFPVLEALSSYRARDHFAWHIRELAIVCQPVDEWDVEPYVDFDVDVIR